MIFYETDIFTEQIVEYIDDQSYSSLQAVLVADPEAGDLIPKTGGLRKIRWLGSGRGKRGGIRIIYYLNATTRFSCSMPTLRIKNQISVHDISRCSKTWSKNI
jgi:hypothetical protein